MTVPTLQREEALQQQGFTAVAGVDEAGRGAWAGPVVAAAVILPLNDPATLEHLAMVKDSKQLPAAQRETLYDEILATTQAIGIGVASHTCIDRHRIIFATRYAMQQAITRLQPGPDYLLIDALPLPDLALPQYAFPKADALSLSVAAASIIAKVTRDRLMQRLDRAYPGYHFARHKGYGTRAHQAALAILGPCKIHRYSFTPIAQLKLPNL